MDEPEYTFYSQHGEDFLLWSLFDYKEAGFYVDVGAFDGVHLSNTYFFEQRGWSGICIEPHPEYFLRCQQARPRSMCLNVACVAGDDVDHVELFTEVSGLYSGVLGGREEDLRERYQRGWGLEFEGLNPIVVPARTLNSILSESLPPGAEIDFVSIDVEGTELDVLRGFDLRTYHPRVLVVETNTDEARGALTTYLAEMGYLEARPLGVNTFYVRDSKDADRLQAMWVDYRSARSLHPLGEAYTLRPFVAEERRSEREWCLDQLQHKDEQLRRLSRREEAALQQLRQQREQLQVLREQEQAHVQQLKEQSTKLQALREREQTYVQRLKQQSAELQDLREREQAYLRQLAYQEQQANEARRRELDYQQRSQQQGEELRAFEGRENTHLQQIDEQAEQLAQLSVVHHVLQMEYERLVRSHSWRLTAPLRRLGATLRLLVGGSKR